jgi:hypothetical protein
MRFAYSTIRKVRIRPHEKKTMTSKRLLKATWPVPNKRVWSTAEWSTNPNAVMPTARLDKTSVRTAREVTKSPAPKKYKISVSSKYGIIVASLWPL